ncbi:MAG: hypothetical protein RLZZ367_2143 [Bacteroidota bacterium]|jgi:YegS/Rv2252/BmrU family lipid kinase
MAIVSFVLHGKHRGNQQLVKQANLLFGSAYRLQFKYTEYAGHAIELARLESQTSNYVIAVGGDGTMNEVVNGVLLSGNKSVIAGLLPCGTGNDFARSIGMRNSLPQLYQLIEARSVKSVDAGLLSFTTPEGKPSTRYFINIADVGLGGFIAQRLSGYTKWMGAFLTFQRAIIAGFLSYRHQPIKAVADTFTYEGNILSYIIANGKYFGAGLGVAPDAELNDGKFHITLGANISLWDYLLNLGNVRKGLKINHPQMSYHTASVINITSPQPLPIDTDGEFAGYTPMQVSMVPGALLMLTAL